VGTQRSRPTKLKQLRNFRWQLSKMNRHNQNTQSVMLESSDLMNTHSEFPFRFSANATTVALPPQQQPGVYKGVGNNNFNEIIRRRLRSACCCAMGPTRHPGISETRLRCMLLHHLRVVAATRGRGLTTMWYMLIRAASFRLRLHDLPAKRGHVHTHVYVYQHQ
jgi:hypothetical protein